MSTRGLPNLFPLRFPALRCRGSFLIRASVYCLLAFLSGIPAGFPQDADEQSQNANDTHPRLEFRKWSGDINVPDPVAVTVDDQGRVYATQTRRRKIQDLDIREHREWIPIDVSLTSVEEKRNFFQSILAVGGDQTMQSQHVRDLDQNGQHDWRDLTVISEAIYRLVDTDGDGRADEITTFAEEFNSEVTGVAAGVMAWNDQIYATIAPDVWKLSDYDQDGKSDARQVIAHGFGLHIAYGGHDMHGLTVGPDGRIYWSIGDKGINVQTPDGKTFSYPHQGGVMRCNPDGSDFEVFAYGLRNVQEFAFDKYGNLFGVDNDADQPGEKERFVQIVDQMDAGWRFYYQHRGSAYNPWTQERLWEQAGEQHAAYLVPPISHYIDGPAGFKYNPGTALSTEYEDYFFVTSAPNGFQHAFRVEATGDSFRMVDEHKIGEGLAIVGLAVGPDGAIYGADWDGGYPLDQKGGIIRIDVADPVARHPERPATQALLAGGVTDLTLTELLGLLGHPDMRLRMASQFTLVDRNEGSHLAAAANNPSNNLLVRLHAVWGLGQLGRQGDLLARDMLGLLCADKDDNLRGQAIKTYGELKDVRPEPLLSHLTDDNLHVRVLAGLAIARHPTPKAVQPLLEQADSLDPSHHYLRHALITALAACASESQLAELSEHENENRRLLAVLALRRIGSASTANFLDDASHWVANAAARAIHDGDSISEGMESLAQSLLARESQTEPFFRRAVNANFRIGSLDAAQRLITFATKENSTDERITHVLEALAEWRTPHVLDRVEGSYRRELDNPAPDTRQLPTEELGVIAEQFVSSDRAPVRLAAINLADKVGIRLSPTLLNTIVRDETVDDAIRVKALESLHTQVQEIMNFAKQSGSDLLRLKAIELQAQSGDGLAASAQLRQLLQSDADIKTKQLAIRSMSEMDGRSVQEFVLELGEQLAAGDLNAALRLEVWEMLQTSADDGPDGLSLLEQIQQRYPGPGGNTRFRFVEQGGDPAAGERIFRTHGQAQCSRCHRVSATGSDIGPVLTKIGEQRKRDYLARAIAAPSADIEEKYRSQLFLLESDEIVKGVLVDKSEDKTVVALSDGSLKEIANPEIIEVKIQDTSLMPELTDVLSPREVRDLVAYLSSLR